MGFWKKKAIDGGVVVDLNTGLVITGTVDGNVIQASGRDFPLTELSLPWRQPRATVESLLSWKTRLARLVGRDEEQSVLLDWAATGPAISVRLIHGPAGTGKTRLAGEIAQTLRDRGWSAGQIELTTESVAFRSDEQGTLLLVDYPEEKRAAVGKLLHALGRMEEPSTPLRVLLLSRHDMLHWQGDVQAAHASEIMDTPLELHPLGDVAPWTLFSAGRLRANEVLEHPEADSPISEEAFVRWLVEDELHGRPLFILAYAVQLAYAPGQPGLKGADIFSWLTAREQARWEHEAREAGMHEQALGRLKALSAITGGLSTGQLRALSAQKHLALNLPESGEIVDRLRQTGELLDNQLPPVEPDLLASNILHVILEAAAEQAGAWVWSALEQSADMSSALDRMSRLSYDMTQTLGHVWPDEAIADEVRGQPERCQRLAQFMSNVRIVSGLLPLSVSVWRTLAETTEDEAEQAGHLNKLSICLRETGDRKGVRRVTIERAVAIYGRLAEHDPAAYEPALAMSLNNLSGCLSETGDHEGARVAIERAVAIQERLAEYNPAAYESDLAMSLSNLSIRLGETGDRKGARVAAERAVTIYGRLAEHNPAAYEPELAMSLNNLSRWLAETGDRESAQVAIRRAVELIQPYAQSGTPYEEWLAYMNRSLEILRG